jgi:AcrR family transcriptional regulator
LLNIYLLTNKQMHPKVLPLDLASSAYISNTTHRMTRSNSPTVSANKLRRTHSERREEAAHSMLEAAVRIVAERGLEELTLAECGEAAGYSRGLAAHYFGTKDELMTAIAQHIVEDYSQRLRADRRMRVGLAGLLDSVEFYIESGRSNLTALRAFHAVLGSAIKQTPLSNAIAELNRNSVDSFARTIQSGIERQEIRRDIEPTAQAALVVSALRGVMTQWLLDPHHIDLDAIKYALRANLQRSLAT